VADPFAGAESMEVRHVRQPGAGAAGGNLTYVINDPKAMTALLNEVKIVGVQNDIGIGSIPTSHLTVRRKNGTSFHAGIESDGSLSCYGGIVHLDNKFITALNRQCSEQQKAKINVLEYLPALPEANPVPEVAPSMQSLTAGFKSLSVQYVIGKR